MDLTKFWNKLDLILMLGVGLALLSNPEFHRILALNPNQQTAALNQSFWWIIVLFSTYRLVRPQPALPNPLKDTDPLNLLKLFVIILLSIGTMVLAIVSLSVSGNLADSNFGLVLTLAILYAICVFFILVRLLRA